MIPIGDSPRARHFPFVNWMLIVINVLVFWYELRLSEGQLTALIGEWGATPIEINQLLEQPLDPSLRTLATLFTSQFIHGGWLHIISNMLFLWIFGDNVEDSLGGGRYLFLYLVCGMVGALAQSVVSGPSAIPLVGASGAIAGVLGAYLLRFPGARVSMLVPIFIFFTVIQLPAIVVILLWFAIQLLNGWAAITTAVQSGIGWWAHIGGFLAGIVLFLFMGGGRARRTTSRV